MEREASTFTITALRHGGYVVLSGEHPDYGVRREPMLATHEIDQALEYIRIQILMKPKTEQKD